MSEVDEWSRVGFLDNWRPALLYFVAPALLIPALLVGGVTAYLTWKPDEPTFRPDSAVIPAPDRTIAMVELFGCLRRGPADCSEFQVSVDFLEQITEGSFLYTPLRPADPGDPVGDGTVRVRLGALPPAGAMAVGAAVTRDGVVAAVPPELTTTVTADRELVQFTVGGSQATVTFALRSESFRLLGITYSARVEGGR